MLINSTPGLSENGGDVHCQRFVLIVSSFFVKDK